MTLLEMVQDILSSMDGDEVNSITDTPEAEQVARLVRRAYTDYIASYDIPELNDVFTLQALGDVTSPTKMQVPNNVDNICWLRYNTRKASDTKDKYVNIEYVVKEDFINRILQRNSSGDNVQIITENGVKLFVHNDKAPSFYTSLNDTDILFDSFDSGVDSTLQSSKTIAYGRVIPSFTLTDSFIPKMDNNLFPIVLNEAKSIAFVELKQQANQKAENESRRQRIKVQNNLSKFDNSYNRPDYGRK